MSTIPELIKHAREADAQGDGEYQREFSGIRSGKARTALLDIVRVEAYGNTVPLNQVGMVAAPETRLLTVQPFDKSLAQAIEKAIRESELGLNPATQGNVGRVPIPPLTQERRRNWSRWSTSWPRRPLAVRHARSETTRQGEEAGAGLRGR